MNWMQVEACAQDDGRCVFPLGSIEQHAYLSLATDMILAEKISVDAAAPLGVPVFPCLPYGMAASFADYPGSLSFSMRTYTGIIEDMLDSMHRSGFRRILLVNGHGGNTHVTVVVDEWLNRHPDTSVKLHDWWRAPRTMAKVRQIDEAFSHASWMENFPWTRLEHAVSPSHSKQQVDYAAISRVDAVRIRERLGDGNYHGLYQRPDADMLAIWDVAIAETRDQIENGWH